MAHQGHSIPWSLIGSNVEFKSIHRAPHRKDFLPANKGTQNSDLNHLARRIGSAIREFSATERKKYHDEFPAPTEGVFLSRDVFELDDPKGQARARFAPDESELRIEHWACFSGGQCAYPAREKTRLADLVKLLLVSASQTPLLMLTKHPDVAIRYLRSMEYGQCVCPNIGIDGAIECFMGVYLYLNFIVASDKQLDPDIGMTASFNNAFRRLVESECVGTSECVQNLLGWRWLGYSIEEAAASIRDSDRVRGFCKDAFRAFYVMDMMVREMGTEVIWEELVKRWLNVLWGFKPPREYERRWGGLVERV